MTLPGIIRLWVLRLCRRYRSPLRREIGNLRRNIDRDEARINAALNVDVRGRHCCHWCAYPWLSDLNNKNERRRKRLTQLLTKLERDTQPNSGKERHAE